MELKQCPEPQAGHADKMYPEANSEQLFYPLTSLQFLSLYSNHYVLLPRSSP